MDHAIAFAMGWGLDLLLGDPVWLPHPVVLMGKWISLLERLFNRGEHRFGAGVFVLIVSVLVAFGAGWALLHLASLAGPWAVVVFEAVVVFFCLAGHTLRHEVALVFSALGRGIEEGRRQVARIVGRDTSALSAQEVRTAALETLAENLSDGVVAPVFWFVLLGVPGILAYKMVNTLDSMVGYKTPRFVRFGCASARADDVANFLPARLTALLIVIAGKPFAANSFSHLAHFVFSNGPRHASPNSGWPEAALASILDCRFGGSHVYFGQEVYKPFIGYNPRPLADADAHKALRICFLAEVLAIVAALFILFFAC